MNKRRGASLLSVMVFLLFAVMITAQVFFFAKSSVDSVAEQREIMMYRMNLDSLVEEAKKSLKVKGSATELYHRDSSSSVSFSSFYTDTKAKYKNTSTEWDAPKWEIGNVEYNVAIYDLDYEFDSHFVRNDYITDYGNTKAHQKIFAAMPRTNVTDSEGNIQYESDGVTPKISGWYYLIRAWVKLPSNYYDRTLMYQVLVWRDENSYKLKTLSFQEVWF